MLLKKHVSTGMSQQVAELYNCMTSFFFMIQASSVNALVSCILSRTISVNQRGVGLSGRGRFGEESLDDSGDRARPNSIFHPGRHLARLVKPAHLGKDSNP